MKRFLCMIAFLLQSPAFGLNLEPILTIGSPLAKVTGANVKEAWNGCVMFLMWRDSDTIIYTKQNILKCHTLSSNSERWSAQVKGEVRDVALGSNSLFVIDESGLFHTFSASDGRVLKILRPEQLATLLGLQYCVPIRMTYLPGREQLVIATSGRLYADNTYLLDANTLQPVAKLKSDGFVAQMNRSANGGHIVSLSSVTASNIRVWDLEQHREIFRFGEDKPVAVDDLFMSNAMFDGRRILIYSIDNGWLTGTVHVYDTERNKEIGHFGSRNGHLAMDVDWSSGRIALTGLSANLHVVDFTGNVLAEGKKAAGERIMAVKFSPDRQRIAVGGLDNTIRVFALTETNANIERVSTSP